ncbi:AraC family transcriptional regulator [Nocardia sp. NBC_00511]|uniref:AraC family transcriptional regulator n=1 Tax=Nocardia sp. NBC_00511 TaxID=2903591 RepID=UPI0030DFD3D8
MANRTVAIQFVRAAMDTAATRGIDIRGALRDVRITPEMIGHDRVRVTAEQAARVVQALWDQTDDELGGLGPRPVARGTFRMITFGVIHAPDLRTALTRFTEFLALSTGLRSDLVEEGGCARIVIHGNPEAQLDPLTLDIAVAVIHRFASWLIRKQIRLTALEFPYPAPTYVSDYRLIFGVTPDFGGTGTAFTFDPMYLSVPVVRTEAELAEFLRSAPAGLLFRSRYDVTTADRVRNILERNTSTEWLSTEEAAKRLSLSAQHVRRLLREEGTSFRAIQEDILRDRAIESLVRGEETIEELSERLGYSEPSAFRRAFRRWTGISPGSYRPALISPPPRPAS